MLKNGHLGKATETLFITETYPCFPEQCFTRGDNLTGAGDGDDEQIIINLAKVPAEYDRIVIVVNIYQAVQRRQHFLV